MLNSKDREPIWTIEETLFQEMDAQARILWLLKKLTRPIGIYHEVENKYLGIKLQPEEFWKVIISGIFKPTPFPVA